ncbi:MAG: glycosyltransferase family 2 protein [Rhizobiaceae bacterium]
MKSTTVLMATYNGCAYLSSQIGSIEKQNLGPIDLLISDDGSTDETLALLAEVERNWAHGTVTIIQGPSLGFAENYRHLITNSPGNSDLYAFSDQDDIWEPDKLALAAEQIDRSNGKPALFCSRTMIVDKDGHDKGLSPLFSATPSFKNAIVQSIAGGNTMVFNRPTRDLLVEASKRTGFVSHDWWAYLLVTGAGGSVHYSTIPKVRYRQHESNIVGANLSWRARMTRLTLMAGGRFAKWNQQNLDALSLCEDLLTDEARELMNEFRKIRSGNFPDRLFRLRQSNIYRQTSLGQFSLYLACALGKI